MIPIKYGEPSFKRKIEGGREYIFDGIRKRWLLLTEEEWVRQNFVAYLITAMGYPSTLIALEKELLLNDLKKRFDILVYDAQHQPWLLVECKASTVPLSEAVLQQVLRYHISIPVKFILITNGDATIGWEKIGSEFALLKELPKWKNM